MIDIFKARLKAKTTAAGVNLSKDRIAAIADRLHKKFPDLTEEADHDQKLDDYNDLQPFDETAKQDDRLRTLEAKTKEPIKQEPPPTDPPKTDPPPAKTDAEKLAALELQFGQLSETVKNYQVKDARQKLNESFQAKLAAKKIPAAFAKRFSVEKEEDIETVLEEAEADFNTMMTEAGANKDIGNKETPKGGSARTNGKVASKEEVDNLLDKIKI